LVSSALVASFPFQREGQRPQLQLLRSLATSNIGGTAATPAAFGAAAYKRCEFRSLSP